MRDALFNFGKYSKNAVCNSIEPKFWHIISFTSLRNAPFMGGGRGRGTRGCKEAGHDLSYFISRFCQFLRC